MSFNIPLDEKSREEAKSRIDKLLREAEEKMKKNPDEDPELNEEGKTLHDFYKEERGIKP